MDQQQLVDDMVARLRELAAAIDAACVSRWILLSVRDDRIRQLESLLRSLSDSPRAAENAAFLERERAEDAADRVEYGKQNETVEKQRQQAWDRVMRVWTATRVDVSESEACMVETSLPIVFQGVRVYPFSRRMYGGIYHDLPKEDESVKQARVRLTEFAARLRYRADSAEREGQGRERLPTKAPMSPPPQCGKDKHVGVKRPTSDRGAQPKRHPSRQTKSDDVTGGPCVFCAWAHNANLTVWEGDGKVFRFPTGKKRKSSRVLILEYVHGQLETGKTSVTANEVASGTGFSEHIAGAFKGYRDAYRALLVTKDGHIALKRPANALPSRTAKETTKKKTNRRP